MGLNPVFMLTLGKSFRTRSRPVARPVVHTDIFVDRVRPSHLETSSFLITFKSRLFTVPRLGEIAVEAGIHLLPPQNDNRSCPPMGQLFGSNVYGFAAYPQVDF
jgi:hypothetical protein